MTRIEQAQQEAAEAQAFLYQHCHAALATVDANGQPFASAVNVVPDHEGRLLMLVSQLAPHTRNIQHNAAVSLMWVEQRHSDWQMAMRLSVSGTVARLPVEQGERYFQLFAHARDYLALDFHFYVLRPQRVRWVAGPASMFDFDGDMLCMPWGWDLPAEQAMLAQMNEEHSAALRHYVKLIGVAPEGALRLLAIDPWGCWLQHRERLRRLPFPARAEDANQARETLMQLADTRPEDFFLTRP